MILFSAVAMSFVAMCSNAADLTVKVEGVRNSKGQVRLAVFDNVGEFPGGIELLGRDVPSTRGSVVVHFNNINQGKYAIAIHHDENNDGEMNTNFIGLPEEGYGFSNNAKVFFSPPSFKSAAFSVQSLDKVVRLKIVY